MKKIISILLAVMMIATLTVTAFAEGDDTPPATTGTITIKHPQANAKYDVYRLLDLVSFVPDTNPDDNIDDGKFAYTVNSAWVGFFETDYAKQYFTVDPVNKAVEAKSTYTEAVAPEFAKKALEYATDTAHPIAPVVADVTGATSGADVVIEGLPLGYYLVDTDLGSLCGLTTTKPTATVAIKNALPQLNKEVQEDSKMNNEDKGWGAENDANIGESFNYRIIVTAKAGAEGYVVHDKMSDGLDFDGITSVTIERKTADGYADAVTVDASNYTVNNNPTDGCTFEVSFKSTFADDLNNYDKVIITYAAKLNADADIDGEVVVDEGKTPVYNPNTSWLTYAGDNSTDEVQTQTKTYKFDIIKTDDKGNLLDGAEFKLYTNKIKDSENDKEIGVALVDAAEDFYRVNGTATGATIVVSGGKITVKGLDGEIFWLEETAAPDGYNMLTARQEVNLKNGNLNATFNDENIYTNGGVKVVNKTGTALPETGGMGTTLFITFGTIAVLGTGVLLVTKKRMGMIQD